MVGQMDISILLMLGMLILVKEYNFILGMVQQQIYNGMNIQEVVTKNMNGILIVGNYHSGY